MQPAYFALVMATGIVAIAMHLQVVAGVPLALLWLNAAFLAALVVATIVRVVRFPSEVLADVRSHGRGVGFFTMPAATGIFGSQLLLELNAVAAATFFWVVTAILWAVVTYGVLTALTVTRTKPTLAEGINGGWLVVVVATQSFAILSVSLAASGGGPGGPEALMFLALVLWLSGGVLYLWLTALILLRYAFERMRPQDLAPPYWINMGAVAISALAGATIVGQASLSPVATELATFTKGLTLTFWAIGSWWIPFLLALGVWRYLLQGDAFAYDPLYWGAVFPFGMYSACTHQLALVLGATYLTPLSQLFMVLAGLAWLAALIGMIDSFRRSSTRMRAGF